MNKAMMMLQLVLVVALMGSPSVVIAAATRSDSGLIRGSTLLQQEQQEPPSNNFHNNNKNRRRHLLQESECDLFRKCVQRPPTDDHPNGYSDDSWVCELSRDDSQRLGVQFVDVVESPSVAPILAKATSGKSSLRMSEAVVDTDKMLAPRMFVPDHATIEIHNNSASPITSPITITDTVGTSIAAAAAAAAADHNGPPTIGTLKTLVIRLSDSEDVQVDSSILKLYNDVFDDDVSLKTQTEACSYGKLKIEPFIGNTPNNEKYITNGIVDVQMTNFDMASGSNDQTNAALQAANDQLGDLSDSMFDLVMFCFPPGSNDFIAYAYANRKYSFYNNEWCGYVSSQMHEVGHNLGLAHSGTKTSEYADESGFMGFSSTLDDQRMCFNAQKNYQLKWYENKVETLDPIDLNGGSREFVLNGISDYDTDNDALVVLRLKQSDKEEDYYIGYNRVVAKGINEDSSQDIDSVTILRKESGNEYEYGKSTKIASLLPGQNFILNDFNGRDKDVQIIFTSRKENGDATILILGDSDRPLPLPPGNCQKFTVQVKTDQYPKDTSWYVMDPETKTVYPGATSQVYKEKEEVYEHEICLVMGNVTKIYQFSISDSYEDGLCCSQGQGFYKLKDDQDNLLFTGDNGSFKVREHFLEVRVDPDTVTEPPPPPPPPCKNTKKRNEEFARKVGGKELVCKKWAKKEKCDSEIKTGSDTNKFIWQVCQRSCARCDNI